MVYIHSACSGSLISGLIKNKKIMKLTRNFFSRPANLLIRSSGDTACL